MARLQKGGGINRYCTNHVLCMYVVVAAGTETDARTLLMSGFVVDDDAIVDAPNAEMHTYRWRTGVDARSIEVSRPCYVSY